MASEIKRNSKLGRTIQNSNYGQGYAWSFQGEGNPTIGSSLEIKQLNDVNAPIGSEYLDLASGTTYVKIDDTPDEERGKYKVGVWSEVGLSIEGIQNSLADGKSGIEFTGGFAGKPISNQYAWQNGSGINIFQADVDADRFKTFSMDSTVQVAVDTPYWTDPTPSDHTGKGVFGGSYLPDGVTNVFDYTTVDSDTYEDGSNVVTTGGLDFSQLKVGDKVDVRFDFNAIPQIANTTIEPAIWYKNRDASDNVTFTFPLTAQPIFYGTGTVGKTYLNRVSLTVYIASQEDINSLSHFAIKSDNPIIIQPLTTLFTLIR